MITLQNRIDLNAVPTDECLRTTRYFDCEAPEVQQYARDVIGDAKTDVDKIVRLYYAVRDDFRYDPRLFLLSREHFCGRQLLKEGSGFCMPKALLLSTLARTQGIPSGMGFAYVVNHLLPDTERDAEGARRPIFHGYSVLHVDGRWLKASPAFNLSMCEKFDTRPLEFDGRSHALFHEYDNRNRRHMEYVEDFGAVAEFPYDLVYFGVFAEQYPDLELTIRELNAT